MIQKINKKGVLAKFNIVYVKYDLQFTPFTSELNWWKMYNGLKHYLTMEQCKINYTVVLNALAGLSALHCLANKLIVALEKDLHIILDAGSWYSEEHFIPSVTLEKKSHEGSLLEIITI